MSDRIAVMSRGEVQQIGTAHDIYDRPRNRFVANFIGETNLLDVTVDSVSGSSVACRLGNGKSIEVSSAGEPSVGSDGHVSIRPEQLVLAKPDSGTLLEGVIDRVIYLGTDNQHLVHLEDGTEIQVRSQASQDTSDGFGPGDKVGIAVNPGAARLLVD